jgi:hypothetical protein
MNLASTIAAVLFAFPALSGQAQNTAPASPIYLRCNVDNEPDGVNDRHIDFANRIVTDAFGTSHSFREDGPFIISETFTEINGKREVATTTRINRYTLALQYIWPAQQILKNGQCSIVEKQM